MIIRSFFSFIILTFPILSHAQSITPFALNNGGGFASTLEWSMSESVSVASFLVPTFSLNTGVLQPNTNIVTSLNEFGPSIFGNQIVIGPNPTSNILHIKARLTQPGSLSYDLIDAKSAIVFMQDAGTIFSSYEKDISIEDYPSGVYYIKVFFKPLTGNIKTGVYKIIKL